MRTTLIAACLLAATALQAQTKIELGQDKVLMHHGDNAEWKSPTLNESGWGTSNLVGNEITQAESWAWYRIHFYLPKSIINSSDIQKELVFSLGKMDDVDMTYLNGELIGKTGSLKTDPKGYSTAWDVTRIYRVPLNSKALKWDSDNVLAIRIYNGDGNGGLCGAPFYAWVPGLIDNMDIKAKYAQIKGREFASFTLTNSGLKIQKGKLEYQYMDPDNGKITKTTKSSVTIGKKSSKVINVAVDDSNPCRIRLVYSNGHATKAGTYVPILTPKEPEKPLLNTAGRYGLRPGSPLYYKIPTTGVRPIRFTVTNMPEGLKLDAENGILSGSVKTPGEYVLNIKAENAKGSDQKQMTIVVGQKIALTPPMGWNSWNCWGLSVSQEKVKSSAQAIIDKGLADYGYAYINIDDAWEAAKRNADGTISPNEKFPDMKGLGDWLHSHGLKFGIYSSPGRVTCGNYLGSLNHEKQDAETYNSWGIDYLKYDWCSYGEVYNQEHDATVGAFIRPYLKMEQYLRAQPRDIFYSLCQYGMADSWRWAEFVDANSWRTTGDITDSWRSLYDIGFVQQRKLYPYGQPGHWNDPDMLIVGKVGWSANLRDTRLTYDEQYTHISLWALLAANMLIGCDVSQMDEFTKRLLCNREVIAVNQDILGKQAKPVVTDGKIEIWMRPLADGSHAIGIFNLGGEDKMVNLSSYYSAMGISAPKGIRDLWRQKDLSTTDTSYFIPTHGVKMLKLK